MTTEVLNGPLGEWRAASTAGGGTALTTTAARIPLPRATKQVQLIPRNFAAGANVVKFNTNPWLTIVKTTDLLATEANWTDYSDKAQDLSTATKVTLNSFDTIANSNALYVGAFYPFGGVDIDVQNTNSNASVLTVKYWTGSAWASISATDNTASAGATSAQDGTVTWTMPTDWVMVDLATAQTATVKNRGLLTEPMFWTRWEVSAALDSTTDWNSAIAINRSTAYAELPTGTMEEFAVTVGPGGIFSITALTDAGTANLIVNCAARLNGRFAS